MTKPRFVVSMLFLTALILNGGAVSGQNFPYKPLRIVTAGVGGGGDFVSRLIAPGLSAALEQPVIVDNRAGAVIPGDTVAKAQPDGHTLLLNSDSLWVTALLQKTPYDPLRDFLPISILDKSPNVLVVHSSVAVNTVKDLIALAKANPGKFHFGTGPTGVPNHISAELFKALAGINIVRVAYGGGGPALNALLAGEVQLMFASAPSVAQHVKSGRLRALAVTSAQRSALVPDLPTIAASGLPGYEVEPIDGLFAPAKTPASIINRLNQEVVRIVKSADMKERFLNAGIEPVGSSPEQLAALMKSDFVRWDKIFRDAGVRAE